MNPNQQPFFPCNPVPNSRGSLRRNEDDVSRSSFRMSITVVPFPLAFNAPSECPRVRLAAEFRASGSDFVSME